MIDASVEKGYGEDYKNDRHVDATFEIKDCNRQASIDFYYHNDRGYKQRLKKIRDMIEALEDLERFMKANPPVRAPKKKKEDSSAEDSTLELTKEMELELVEEGSLSVTTEAVNDLPAPRVLQTTAIVRPVRRSRLNPLDPRYVRPGAVR
jgi:hypothetical protein